MRARMRARMRMRFTVLILCVYMYVSVSMSPVCWRHNRFRHSLVPRPHPVFQCCTLKNGRTWYLNDIIAERVSARHLILEYGLFERIYVSMYVCMSVTLRNAIINAHAHAYVHSIDVLYLLPRDFFFLAGAQYV